METKIVQKEKKAVAQYDENGKMLIPYKENGETTLKTQEQMKSILDKKDKKQKVGQKAIQNTKQKAKVREKKQANPKFRDDFAKKAVENIKDLERVDKDDKVLLKYKKFTLARLMLRTYGFCAYRKDVDGSRMTLRVTNDKTSQELFDWCKERVEHLKANVKPPKVKKAKVVKPKNHAKKVTVEQKLEKAEAVAKKGHGNGFDLKSSKIRVTDEVKTWIQDHGYKLECTSVKF